MPLKRSYATEAEVPTERKADYVLKGGRYVLDVEGFDNIDSVLDKNTELLGKVSGHVSELQAKQSEVTRLTGEVSRLSGELATAQGSALQRGQRAVSIADAELLEKVKELGTFEEVKAKLEKYPTLEATVTKQERRAELDRIRKTEGWREGAVDVLELIHESLPEVEQRDTTEKNADGTPKKKNIAKVKGANDVVTEQDFSAWFAAAYPHLQPSVKAAKSDDGTELPEHGAGGGASGGDMLEKRLIAQRAAQAANPNPLMPKTPAAPATA
jgi:hypothetical protein